MAARESEHDVQDSLAAKLAELANQPAGEGRLARARAGAVERAQRWTTRGVIGPVAEVGWRTARRDASIGGSVLGAALAYRLFVWMLPLALVLVLGVGLAAGTSGTTTGELVRDAGLTGFIAGSVAATSREAQGWGAVLGLAGGLVVLVYLTFALLRALRAVTALAWRLPVRPPARPARDTFLFLAWTAAFGLSAASSAPLRARLDAPWSLLAALAVYAVLPVLFVTLFWWLLPHAAEHWTELVPGALLAGGGIALVGLFNSLVLFPWLAEREETYGVLGVAAGLLFGFFLVGRTVELAAALNAVLAEQRQARDGRRLAR
jgi:uncharacterized BrkB/YihY/UPF0761 family membrane protein